MKKTKEVKKADKLSANQYIALAMFSVALAVLIYGVPALTLMDNLFPAVIVCIACFVTMAITVFKGGLTDVSGE